MPPVWELRQVSPQEQEPPRELRQAVPPVLALQQAWLPELAERQAVPPEREQLQERQERVLLQVELREREPQVWAVRASGRVVAAVAAYRRRRSEATCRR